MQSNKNLKRTLIFICLQQTKNLDQFGIGIKNEIPPWDSPPVFKMLKILGRKNLLHINVTHSCPEQLRKFLFRDKKLSLQGWALVNDMAATTHICQILKPLEYGVGGSKLVLPDNLRVKLGPRRAVTAFGHRWWGKVAR